MFSHEPGYVGYDRYVDHVEQRAVSQHFKAEGSDAGEFRIPFRYVWPSELDLMARFAGMTLRERWAGRLGLLDPHRREHGASRSGRNRLGRSSIHLGGKADRTSFGAFLSSAAR